MAFQYIQIFITRYILMGVYQDSAMPDIPTTQITFTHYSVPTGYAEMNKLLI